MIKFGPRNQSLNPARSYDSRLFFLQEVKHKGKGTNWNARAVCILGEKWWAFSWKISVENKTLLSKVLGHLEAMSNGRTA